METDAGRDLRRALDEGIVISGEVEVKLLGLRVLPVKVNLVIGSTALAERLGLNWWAAKNKNGRRPDRSGGRGRSDRAPRSNGPPTHRRGSNGQA
jgi:hypothetical protein